MPVNGTAQTATSGSRRIGIRVAGSLRRIYAAPQYEVMLSPDWADRDARRVILF
jgi:hypothetical protein